MKSEILASLSTHWNVNSMEMTMYSPRCVTLCLLVLVSLLSGCAAFLNPTQIRCTLDTLAEINATAKNHYVIVPGDQSINSNSPQFKEFSLYVDTVLAEAGYVKEESENKADAVIAMKYSISEPDASYYTYEEAIQGVTEMRETTDYSRGHPRKVLEPVYGTTGYVTRTGVSLTYTRSFSIAGYDAAAHLRENKLIRFWSADVVSRGNSDDLGHIFPFMVLAWKRYVGATTWSGTTVDIPENDPDLKTLRRGASLAAKARQPEPVQ